MAQSLYLNGCDRDIGKATQSIETARDNTRRAAAYTERGKAYSEKARYSRAFKLISADEYGRLFGLALQDHDQATALDPANAVAFFSRGEAYYDRAVLEEGADTKKLWFDRAGADFKKAVEKDSRHYLAWDRLGLVHESTGDFDQAIADYTQEMALDPLGRMRLADAYCARGSANQTNKKYDAATADYEKSIEIGASADGCSCDPYDPLVGLYDEASRYDKGWEVVHKAQKSRKSIAPELLEKLKKDSGRSN